MHIELRDLTEEDNFKEQMRSKINDIDDEYMSIGTPKTLSQSSNILSGMSSKTTLKETTRKETILDKNSLDEETQADRIARIDKKKEKVKRC